MVPIQLREYDELPSDTIKAEVVRQVLGQIRSRARKAAVEEDPARFAQIRGRQLPRRQRRAIEDVTGRSLDEIIQCLGSGAMPVREP